MRITYLHQYFVTPDQPGGTRSYEMAKRWADAGHDVQIVTSDREPGEKARPGARTEQIDDVTVHWLHVPYDNAMGASARLRAFLTFAYRSAALARRLDGDVVFATSTPLTIVLPALFAVLGRRTPMVFEVRDLWPAVPIAMGALKNPLARRAALLLERVAYSRAAAIIALSRDMARHIVDLGYPADKVVVATNASDLELFDVNDDVGRAFRRDELGIGETPLVVYCGTLGRANRVSYLVEIAASLKAMGTDAVVAIFGSGWERQQIADLARAEGVLGTSLLLRDPVAKRDLPKVINAADLCISLFIPEPVLATNSANKYFDAMAAGRPVAINYGGWQAEDIAQHGTGMVLPAADPQAAARMIASWLRTSPESKQAQRLAARRLAETEFSRDMIAARVLEVLVTAGTPSATRRTARTSSRSRRSTLG